MTVAAVFIPNSVISTVLFVAAYVLAGYEVFIAMFKGLSRGDLFDENFLMGIASLGAFIVGERTEAVAVLIFYGIGELCQNLAISKSRQNIASLMDIRPDYANLITENGTQTVSPEKVEKGSMILVKPGEKIPLDGIIVNGTGSVDTSALTGESMPRDVAEGAEVLSGSINLNGLLEIRTTSDFNDSTVSKILELVENASSNKAESEKFITKFAKVYTPLVVGAAVVVAFIPPIFLGDLSTWVYRALNFLIISCPCALVLSIPMSFFGGIGGAARQGVLVKGGNFLEALNQADTFIFDKTGTLTKGKFKVSALKVMSKAETANDEICRTAYALEKGSNHPIAMAVTEYCKKYVTDNGYVAVNVNETAGMGVTADINGKCCFAGNAKLLKKLQTMMPESKS